MSERAGTRRSWHLPLAVAASALVACGIGKVPSPAGPAGGTGASGTAGKVARFPLVEVAEVELPGGATRFDYQDIDTKRSRLIVAHMGDDSVIVLALNDGSVVKLIEGIPTPRGVATGGDRIFVTSCPSWLVILDAESLDEIARVLTGNGPDGVGYDPAHRIVGVSDQRDGAISLIADDGEGARTQVALGGETGNVVFDSSRGAFWTAVSNAKQHDQLVRIDPVAKAVTGRIDLPGCAGAHGLRLLPDGKSAFVACEDGDAVQRVDLEGAHEIVQAATGAGPDVLSLDPGNGWLYVASESGDLVVFHIGGRGLEVVDREHVGDDAHSVQVDPVTHRAFFPLARGPEAKPVMRIMLPRIGAP
jgi:DNA-binding beta-propeller fold protein YncE